MTDVSFEEEQRLPTTQVAPTNQPSKGLIGLVIKSGIAKTEAQANMVLIGVAVFALIATAFVLLSGSSTSQPTPEELEALNQMMQQPGAGR